MNIKERKNMIILAVAVFLVLSIVLFFIFSNSSKENDLTPKEKQEKRDKEVAELFDYDETLETTVRYGLELQDRGTLYEGFYAGKERYLTLSYTKTQAFNEKYPANHVTWVTLKKDDASLTTLGNGLPTSIYKEKNQPFVKEKGGTFFIFHERTRIDEEGKTLKGYIYRIKETGKPVLVYETKGVFDSAGRTKNGQLYIRERIYDDPYNMFPTLFKPYDLMEVTLSDKGWKAKKIKRVTPEIPTKQKAN